MAIVESVRPLGERARVRHYHETRRGRVVAFVIQLELDLPPAEAMTLAEEDIKENWERYQEEFFRRNRR